MTRDRWESHCKEIFLHKASVAHGHLKPMDFQLVVFGQSNLDEELADVLALVALQLNHFSILRVLDHSTIAGKFLLERLHQFLFIVIIRDALDSGEGLPAVPLLDPYMDVVLSAGRKQVITLTCISKGVEGLEVLDSGHTIRFPSLGEAAAAGQCGAAAAALGDAERPGPGQMMAIRELKVCLLGDTGVGKSSIVCRFVQDHFDHNISPTIGASFMTKTVPCGNELHKFLIWDTAGQERFHSLAPMYYRGSAAAVIVYDITKQDSFHTLKKWVKELKEHGPENIVMAIAGNKCDLSDIREVPMKDAKEYAESIGAIVVETSAKNAVNIEELFQGISQQIPPLDPHENGNNGAIKLGRQTSQTGRRCC